MRTAKTLIRLDAKADLSLRWAHTHFVGFLMSWLISILLLYAHHQILFILYDYTAIS